MADEITSGSRTKPEWSFRTISIGPSLQRKCSCGGIASFDGECEECKKKAAPQRKAAGQISPTQTAPSIVHEVLQSPGQPLDPSTRSFMESRFRCDFSHVRVHTGARADEAARSVSALAFTVGSDLVFAEGHYATHSKRGWSLIAHELTHTLQQGKTPKRIPARLPMEPAQDELELYANRNAYCIAADIPVEHSAGSTGDLRLQRQPAPAAGKTCSIEVCFVSIEKYGLGKLGFKHAVVNVDTGTGPKHFEVDPDVHRPTGMLHSHVVSAAGRRKGSDCQTLPATCAEAANVVAAAKEYESKDVIYDPATITGPNSNSFAEWTLAKAGLNTATVKAPFGSSGWDYFNKNPAERTDPPHILRSRPTAAPRSAKTSAGAKCAKVFKRAETAAEYVNLVREAESRMTRAGISTNPEKIKVLRGLYYGTPWSVDFADQRSLSRIAGFQIFTDSGAKYPRDPLSLFDCGLYQALQLSQDIIAKSGKVDVGHLMIALDARNATVGGIISTPNVPFPVFGGSGVEIVTWLGDLGGGAASLAIDRARRPNWPVSTKFKGSTDYGAASNLEGDVAGFLVARASGGSFGADAPSIPTGKGIADALDDYFAPSAKAPSTAWDQRARTFLTIYGGAFNAAGDLTNAPKVIAHFSVKIEDFACAYLAQRKADSSAKISDAEFINAADNIRSCAIEVAETFVNALVDTSKSPRRTMEAKRFPAPRPPSPGACSAMTATLRLKLKLKGLGRRLSF